MDKISFPFRSSTHLPFLHVVAESGAWEKHGLDVETTRLGIKAMLDEQPAPLRG